MMMGKGSRGIWLVMVAGVVAGIGAILYYQMVFVPRAERDREAGIVEQWAEQWHRTRACLVGNPPAAAAAADAVVLQEALHGPTTGCVGVFKELSRPGSDSSGNPAVEQAWDKLLRGVADVANAYAVRVDRDSRKPEAERLQILGDKLAAADAAYGELRRRIGLPPASYGTPVLEVQEARPTPLTWKGNPVNLSGAELVAPVLIAGNSAGEVWVEAPDKVRLVPLPYDAFRAIDDGAAWAASVAHDDKDAPSLLVTALDDAGQPLAAAGGKRGLVRRGGPAEVFEVRGALGQGPARAVVYTRIAADHGAPPSDEADDSDEGEAGWSGAPTVELHVARSNDGGATWADNQVATAYGFTVDVAPVQRRCGAVWGEAPASWLSLRAAALAAPLAPQEVGKELADSTLVDHCATATAMLLILPRAVIVAPDDPTQPKQGIALEETVSALAACGPPARALLWLDGEPHRQALCGERACRSFAAPLVPAIAATLVDDKEALMIGQHGRLLLPWRDGAVAGPALRLPAGLTLQALAAWNGTRYAVLLEAGGAGSLLPLQVP